MENYINEAKERSAYTHFFWVVFLHSHGVEMFD